VGKVLYLFRNLIYLTSSKSIYSPSVFLFRFFDGSVYSMVILPWVVFFELPILLEFDLGATMIPNIRIIALIAYHIRITTNKPTKNVFTIHNLSFGKIKKNKGLENDFKFYFYIFEITRSSGTVEYFSFNFSTNI
jgi:hypothetical protein